MNDPFLDILHLLSGGVVVAFCCRLLFWLVAILRMENGEWSVLCCALLEERKRE